MTSNSGERRAESTRRAALRSPLSALRSPLYSVLLLLGAVGALVWSRWETGTRPGRSSAAPPRRRTSRPVYSPTIRVSLTRAPVRGLTLAVDGAFRMRSLEDGRTLERASELDETRVTCTGQGFHIAGKNYKSPRIELVADRSPAIWVNDHQYRGTVRLIRRSDESFLAVNTLPLEQYVASVVDSEMPAAFPDAARHAQAIVARTYAMYEIRHSRDHPHFDLYASSKSQRYLGFQYRNDKGERLAGESDDSRRITRDTAGVVCTDDGDLFHTYYSAVCGGRTTAGRRVFTDAASVLQAVSCRWCREAELYRWKRSVPRSEASAAFDRYFSGRDRPFGRLHSVTPSGKPVQGVRRRKPEFREFVVSDGQHRYRVSSAALRRDVFPELLFSPHFSLRDTSDGLVFYGRGHGHGVGLCQWGARGLARAGRNGLEIVRYYYPGVRVVRVKPPGSDRGD